MKKRIVTLVLTAAAFVAMFACGGEQKAVPTMANDADSMAYVVGMNIAYNILEMDSTINREVVLMGLPHDTEKAVFKFILKHKGGNHCASKARPSTQNFKGLFLFGKGAFLGVLQQINEQHRNGKGKKTIKQGVSKSK